MPIASDELLIVGCVSDDIEKLYQHKKWCPVLATEEMVGTDEIAIFNWSENAVSHVMQIGEWRLLAGLAYEVEVVFFDELVEPSVAKWDIESFINEAITGDPCHISHIYGCELRAFPQGILDAGPERRTELAGTHAVPNHKKFRSHPDWVSSVRLLATKHCFSAFYEGCEEGLVEVGIEKGYITREDIDISRKKRGMMEDYSI